MPVTSEPLRIRREVFLALVSTMACATPRPADTQPPSAVVIASAPTSAAAPVPTLTLPPPSPSAAAATGPEIEIVDAESENDELARLPGPACEEALDLPMPRHDEPSAPSIRLGALTVSGRTPPSEILRTLRTRARGVLGHCASLVSPEMGEPRVAVRILFDQDGVTRSTADYPNVDIGPEPLRGCVLAALNTLTYPPPQPGGGTSNLVHFVAPMYFRHTRPRYDRKEMQAWANRINVPCKNKKPPPRSP